MLPCLLLLFSHGQHSVWAIALEHISNRNLLCFQGKLVSGVFKNNIPCVSNYVQSSFFLSQKGMYVSYLYAPYLTQTLMTLKGSICTFSELHCLGREDQYCQSYCRMLVGKFSGEETFYCRVFQQSSGLFEIFMTNYRNTLKRCFILT